MIWWSGRYATGRSVSPAWNTSMRIYMCIYKYIHVTNIRTYNRQAGIHSYVQMYVCKHLYKRNTYIEIIYIQYIYISIQHGHTHTMKDRTNRHQLAWSAESRTRTSMDPEMDGEYHTCAAHQQQADTSSWSKRCLVLNFTRRLGKLQLSASALFRLLTWY